MKAGPYTFRVHRQSWSRYELLLSDLAAKGVPELTLKRGLAAIKATVDQGDLPDDAETLPDIDGKPAFAVSRFGYRFHFYADEALMTLVVARIGAVGRSATPEA